MPLPPAPNPPPILIVGPTASGKSDWAVEIAQRVDGEIVNVDSRQVYRRLDVGTAKPTPAQRSAVPHHCLDLVDAAERYSLAEYLTAARTAMADIASRGKRPVIVGGAGQHMRAIREGWQIPPSPPNQALRGQHLYVAYRRGRGALHHHLRQVDPAAAEAISAGNLRRVSRALEVYESTGVPISEWQQKRAPLECIAIGPQLTVEALARRIDERTEAMFSGGIIEETQALLDEGVPDNAPGFDSIGYRETIDLLRGRIDRSAAIELVAEHTKRLARNQAKWFRPDDSTIHWAASIPWRVLE